MTKFNDLPKNLKKHVLDANNNLKPFYHIGNPEMNYRNAKEHNKKFKFLNHRVGSDRKRNCYRTTSRANSTTCKTNMSLDESDKDLEGCFAFPIASKPNGESTQFAFLSNFESKQLFKKTSLPVSEYNKILREKATKIITFRSLDVGDDGIDIEVDNNLETNTSRIYQEKTQVEPYERDGIVIGHWSLREKSFKILKENIFKQLFEVVFGDFNFGRSCVECIGLNVYTGQKDCSYVRPSPRMSKEAVLYSQYYRESWDVTFLPLVNKIVNALVFLSTDYQMCNNCTFDLFQKQCLKMHHASSSDEFSSFQSSEQNRCLCSFNRHSMLNIITYCNSKASGFSNNPHYDRNDIWSEKQKEVAERVLESLRRYYSEDDIPPTFSKMKHHLEKMSVASIDQSFSNYTTCGYHLYLKNEISGIEYYYIACFLYLQSRISMNIPPNKTCFHTFGGAMERHLTPVSILVANGIVHIKDNRLSVFAWGGAKSPARVYMEENGGNIAGDRITMQDIRNFYNSANNEQRQHIMRNHWLRGQDERPNVIRRRSG